VSAHQIPRRPADAAPPPLDFDALRAAGMQALRDLCGETWTDHNLHDPGITLLEAYAYALSEQGYRVAAPLTELLSDVQGEIDYAGLGLLPAESSLCCRPTTADDLRRYLLDAVPGLHDVQIEIGADAAAQPMLWQLAVEPLPDADEAAEAELLRALRVAFASQRQFGEDLSDRIRLLRPRRCRLQVVLEIGGAREPAELLAELLHVAQQHLAGLPGELPEGEGGPWLRQGLRPLPQPRPAATRMAELIACLRAVDGVKELSALQLLALDGAPLGEERLALQLPRRAEELEGLRLLRRGSAVQPEPLQVLARLADLQRQQRRQQAAVLPQSLPAGRPQDDQPYRSFAEQLPGVYGLQQPTPANAAARGYLGLFDQLLANAQQQLRGLPDLFSVQGDLRRSHWWTLLDEAQAPGITVLYDRQGDPGGARLQRRAFADFDDADARRHRALDAVMALHGQVYAQNTMRQFLGHLGPAGQREALLRNKASFARQLSRLNRDRGAGRDVLRPEAPALGLAQRLPLLLGLVESPPGLRRALAGSGLRGLREGAHGQALPSGLQRLGELQPEPAGVPLVELLPAACLPDGALPLPLLRAARDVGAWCWGEGGLWLRAADGAWRLGDAVDLAAARRLAARLQTALRAVHEASEGLQLIEHVLLRPRGGPRAQGPADDFYALRASLLLPAWSLRAQQQGFRAFAEETLQLNAPAHVQTACVWLDASQWLHFEPAHARWLQALRKQGLQPEDAAACAELDAAADALLQAVPALRQRWQVL
jgi:hypothetical protein